MRIVGIEPILRAAVGLADIRRAIAIPLRADESVTDPASLVEIIRREAADLGRRGRS